MQESEELRQLKDYLIEELKYCDWCDLTHIDRLFAILTPTIWIQSVRGELYPLASKIGGHPDLPRGQQWPLSSTEKPMRFVAQVDLAQLPRGEVDNPSC